MVFPKDLLTFAEIVPFHSLALLGGPSLFAALPDAEDGRDIRVPFIDAHMRLLQTRPSVDMTLASIPPEVDAVYLLPIPEMSMDPCCSAPESWRMHKIGRKSPLSMAINAGDCA